MFFFFLGKSWGKWMENGWKLDGQTDVFFLVGKMMPLRTATWSDE